MFEIGGRVSAQFFPITRNEIRSTIENGRDVDAMVEKRMYLSNSSADNMLYL